MARDSYKSFRLEALRVAKCDADDRAARTKKDYQVIATPEGFSVERYMGRKPLTGSVVHYAIGGQRAAKG